jgi:rRNA processing protein Krr1/Pno1
MAAEHFTQIRASRRHSQGGAAPGHVTAYVRVPLRVVGLVVGPKGATIKRIQQDTHSYIITPSRDREPIFEVTGLPQNVEAARREIEQHIYQRTGSIPITDQNASISNYDLKAAVVAASNSNMTNRPNYGALAVRTFKDSLRLLLQAGTHEAHRQSAYNLLVQAQQLFKQGQASGDYNAINAATAAYNSAWKK